MKKARTLITLPEGSAPLAKAAKAVLEGASRTRAKAVLAEASPETGADSFDFVFLGCASYWGAPSLREFVESNDWNGKKVAVFSVGASKEALEALSETLSEKGASVIATLDLRLGGLLSFAGFGGLSEQDLIRARGFGERTANTAFSFKVPKNKEKHHIKGYLKQKKRGGRRRRKK